MSDINAQGIPRRAGRRRARPLARQPAGPPAHEHFAGYPGRYGLLHDTTLCVGCRSCEVACSEVNELPGAGPPDDRRSSTSAGGRPTRCSPWSTATGAARGEPPVYRKQQCMHCNEPCCASVCFVRAFTKTPEGPVLYNPDVCVGCRYCVMACPYYALAYEYDKPLTPRVDALHHVLRPRIKRGCTPAAPRPARRARSPSAGARSCSQVARERIRKQPDRYVDHIFGEHEFGGTSWLVLAGVPLRQLGLPEGASHTAAARS